MRLLFTQNSCPKGARYGDYYYQTAANGLQLPIFFRKTAQNPHSHAPIFNFAITSVSHVLTFSETTFSLFFFAWCLRRYCDSIVAGASNGLSVLCQHHGNIIDSASCDGFPNQLLCCKIDILSSPDKNRTNFHIFQHVIQTIGT